MTYQNHSDDKAAADEASSLFLSSGDAKPKQKTNGVPTVPTMQARIATCLFLLGTLAVLFWGGSSNTNTNTNTHRTDGTLEALLLGHPLAAREEYYDPSHGYCFHDSTLEQHCWYPTKNYHVGNWKFLRIGGFFLWFRVPSNITHSTTHSTAEPAGVRSKTELLF